MLRFKELHSGPAKLLSKQVGGAITQPPAYIAGQTGGKDPKPKKEPKVKVDKSINFSSFEWRQENFPVIADYGGEANLEYVIREKTEELLKYLKAQPEKLMKEQDIWDIVKDTITEIEEAFASNDYNEIELAYTNATDMLSEKDGGLDKKKFVDVKLPKEKTVKKKKAAAEDDDEDIDVIEGSKRKRKPQLKGPERIKHHFKVLREERAQYKDRLINAKNWIKKREEELRTRKTWSGLDISDKEMISIPLKIEAKRKQYDAIKKEWIEKRQGVYERAKAKYEKLMGVKIDDDKPKKPKKEGLQLTKAEAVEQQVQELIPTEDIRYRKKRPMELNELDVKEIGAIQEPPRAPKRKAPPVPQYDDEPGAQVGGPHLKHSAEYIADLEEALGQARAENKELRRRLQIYEEAEKVKKEVEKEVKELIEPSPPKPKKPKKKEESSKKELSELDKCKEELAKCKEELAMKEDIDVIVPSRKSKKSKSVKPFNTYTVDQLKAKLKEFKIAGYSTMKKPELLATLQKYYDDHPELEKREPNSKPNLIATIKHSGSGQYGINSWMNDLIAN